MITRPSRLLLSSTVLLLAITSFSLSSVMAARNIPLAITEYGSTSLAAAVMDAGRTAVSAYLYERADLYFHMGKERKVPLAFQDNIFQRMTVSLSPSEHVHRSGASVQEILPWLWLASKADPNNIQHYLVASFWLANEAGHPELARKLLAEARWNNPFSYPVAMEDASIALKHGNTREAAALLDAGLAFWARDTRTYGEDEKNDKARMLLYRALLYEAAGDAASAVALLEEIIKLYPARHEIETRIAELKAGKEPSLLASSAWSDILHAEIDSRKEHNCEYDVHDAHGDHH